MVGAQIRRWRTATFATAPILSRVSNACPRCYTPRRPGLCSRAETNRTQILRNDLTGGILSVSVGRSRLAGVLWPVRMGSMLSPVVLPQ